jgi:hypothetical protein
MNVTTLAFLASLPFTVITVNGVKVQAMIDTGSFQRVQLSSTLAAKLNLQTAESDATQRRYGQNAKRVAHAVVDELAVGDYREAHAPVAIVEGDLERIAAQTGVPFDAILGWGFWSAFETELDAKAHAIRFSREPFAHSGTPAATLDYREVNRAPVVDANLGGVHTTALFDTGAPVSTIDTTGFSLQPGTKVERRLQAGTLDLITTFRAKDLAAMKAGVHASAVIGNDILADYVVAWAPARRQIVLLRQ